MSNVNQVYKRIFELQREYLELAVGRESLLKILYEAEVSEQVYNSNAIENSTLSLEETDKILQQIDLDRFISERELFEAKNLARVVEYTHVKAPQRPMDLEVIMLMHQMLISNIRDEIAGRFRNDDEWVKVGSHIAVDPKRVVPMLQAMMVDYQSSAQEHITRRIARLHLTFEQIHPFVDGNGRIGRAVNNYLLIREGYVPINIKFIDRSQYYDAFEEFNSKGTTKVMEEIVAKALTSSYHKRLAYMQGKKIVLLKDYAKEGKLSASNLINKAKRQTIDAFWGRVGAID